jgi:threonylcarbamoyladenosine tRNA methylthiotransferase MtaB
VAGYYVENFGCRATQADGAALERQFEERGLVRAVAADASVVVLNTCTVTAAADQDARAAIRRVRRENPGAKIVVTGCYAQRAPEEIAAIPGVSVVVGNSHKHRLAEIVLGGSEAPGLSVQENDGQGWGNQEVKIPTLSQTARQGWGNRDPQGKVNIPTSRKGGETSGTHATLIPVHALTSSQRESDDAAYKTSSEIFVSDIFAHTELLAAPVFESGASEGERTRPNLKVQDGCDNRCSFCVIPYVRGQSRSLELREVIREVQALVVAGFREVVISGINLGRWGRDLASGDGPSASGSRLSGAGGQQANAENGSQAIGVRKPDGEGRTPAFEDLVRAILVETTLEKLRISSVEPMDWSDELIELVATSPRIAKHAHVPMQSGSDAVLRRMHRKYRPWHYREKIEKIRAATPEAAIGADVMVGFPGETNAEFEETRRMVDELPFTYLHVFTYSARPGTPAAEMREQVPVRVARERNRILREIAAEKKLAFMRGFVGKEIEAITLRGGEALTENYLKMKLSGWHEANRWVRARVENVVDGELVGRIVGSGVERRG